MNGWCILALVLLALFLLGQLRIGVRGAYTADGLTAGARNRAGADTALSLQKE